MLSETPPKRDKPRHGAGSDKAQEFFSKKLKHRILDNVTKFKDSGSQLFDISGFEPKHAVTAKGVYGRRA